MKYAKSILALSILIGLLFPYEVKIFAQSDSKNNIGRVIIDSIGIMRWSDNNKLVKGFGVNYSVPFAHAYRSAKKLGINVYDAIDQDVYHFSRLGFDLYRIHVWDTEISDTLGNLIDNEHLRAFDYLISKLNERNIKYILTPIAFWGNGWPEMDRETPGFSHKYGKSACLTNPEAIMAQENYLKQFINHRNIYSGISFVDDPNLIAVEISNEPHHRGEPEKVQEYVSRMIQAVKSTGFTNPVLYNFSHGINYVEQYIDAGAEGGTFQWYPTGLGYKKELPGNFLPNVDRYTIPFDSLLREKGIARTVYEFDAADLNKSYMYPAMARSFRTAGIQLATHFSYDPTYLAPYNTEYNTHFMNLAYTPHKALALMIAGHIFHEVPMYENYGDYPSNQQFGNVTIDPENDLVVYNSPEMYIHTNDTEQAPLEAKKLLSIAGHGSSPVLKYEGTGAYFLDKIFEGFWRLEVMPDVLVYDDPFGNNNLSHKHACIQWNMHKMQILMDELGQDFTVAGIGRGNQRRIIAEDHSFKILPGTYFVIANTKWKTIKNINKNRYFIPLTEEEFHAPLSNVDEINVVNRTVRTHTPGYDLSMLFDVVAPDSILDVSVHFIHGFRSKSYSLKKQNGFSYRTVIPAENLSEGIGRYYLSVKTVSDTISFPGDIQGQPSDWDFPWERPYQITLFDKNAPYFLFEPEKNWSDLRYRYWPDRLHLVPYNSRGESHLKLEINQLHKNDPENPDGPVIEDYTLHYFLDDLIREDSLLLQNKTQLKFELANPSQDVSLQIALVDNKGTAFGKKIPVRKNLEIISVSLAELGIVKTVVMPRPYPTFLPYYFQHSMDHSLNLTEIQRVQLSIGPPTRDAQSEGTHKIVLGKIWLE